MQVTDSAAHSTATATAEEFRSSVPEDRRSHPPGIPPLPPTSTTSRFALGFRVSSSGSSRTSLDEDSAQSQPSTNAPRFTGILKPEAPDAPNREREPQ